MKDTLKQIGIVLASTLIISTVVFVVEKGNVSNTVLSVIDTISELPALQVWTSLLVEGLFGISEPGSIGNITAITTIRAFLETFLLGLFTRFFISLKHFTQGKHAKKTIDLLPTYFGTIAGLVVISFIELCPEVLSMIFEIVLIGVILTVAKYFLVPKLMALFLVSKELWYMVVDSIYAVVVCGYVSVIVKATTGWYQSEGYAITLIVGYSVFVALSGWLAYLFSGRKLI